MELVQAPTKFHYYFMLQLVNNMVLNYEHIHNQGAANKQAPGRSVRPQKTLAGASVVCKRSMRPHLCLCCFPPSAPSSTPEDSLAKRYAILGSSGSPASLLSLLHTHVQ